MNIRTKEIIRRKRSTLNMIFDILNILDQNKNSKSNIRLTRLMYSANLSYKQLIEYINFLSDKGWLIYDNLSKKISITQKGLETFQMLKNINSIVVNNLGLQI